MKHWSNDIETLSIGPRVTIFAIVGVCVKDSRFWSLEYDSLVSVNFRSSNENRGIFCDFRPCYYLYHELTNDRYVQFISIRVESIKY